MLFPSCILRDHIPEISSSPKNVSKQCRASLAPQGPKRETPPDSVHPRCSKFLLVAKAKSRSEHQKDSGTADCD
eukprot:8313288-Pyramimonas_sp.AAC.1